MQRRVAFITSTLKRVGSSYDSPVLERLNLKPESIFPALFWLQKRGAKVTGSDIRVGNIIERKGKLHQVLKTQHTQQGRGGATIQIEMRDVKSGLKSSERLRTSETIEKVFVDEKNLTFLYKDGNEVNLMDPDTFDQHSFPSEIFGEYAVFLKDGMAVSVQYFNGDPLSAAVPARVVCKVEESEPYFKGQTITAVPKKVTLDNGLVIQVPGFISVGDDVVIDTASNSYVTRQKGGE